jgi:hypothetical protein
MDLPVIVIILSQSIPQERQHGLQAIFISKSSDPVHHIRKNSLFLGRVIVELGVELEIGM